MSTKENFRKYLEAIGYTRDDEDNGNSNLFEKTYVESEVDYIDFVVRNEGGYETILCEDVPEDLAEDNFWFEFMDSEDNQRWGNLTPAEALVQVVGNKLYYIKFKAVKRYLVENMEEYFETQIPLDKKNPRGNYVLGYAIPVEDLTELGLAYEMATVR